MTIKEIIRKNVENQIVFCDECGKQIGELGALIVYA